MRQKTEEEELAVKYLLGRLSEEERQSLEQRFLDDPEFFEQLLSVESALTDEYIQGNLSGDDRTRFEKLVNSSRSQWREVEFTRDLLQVISSTALERKGADPQGRGYRFFRLDWTGASARYAVLAGVVLLLACGAGMLMWSLSLRTQVTQLRGELNAARAREAEAVRQLDDARSLNENRAAGLKPPGGNEQKNGSPANQESGLPQQAVATIVLTPVSVNRGSKAAPVVTIPPTAQTLRFRLVLTRSPQFAAYAVEVRTFEGKVIWRRDGLQPVNDRTLIFNLPASALPNNDYIVSLEGSASGGAYSDIQDYPFTLRR